MSRLTKEKEKKVWLLSGFIAMVIFLVSIPVYIELIDHILTVNTTSERYLDSIRTVARDPIFNFFDVIDLTTFMLLALLVGPAWIYRKDRNWKDNIDSNVPSLLREISDAQKTGLPLPRAIQEASKHQYGSLTPGLKKMAAQISWGIPFSDALRWLTKEADTPLMRRTSLLILEAERSGGAIEDVFESAHKHVAETLGLKRERQSSMKPYTWIVYSAFIVFILVILVLLGTFFIQLAKQVVETTAEGQAPTTSIPFNVAGLEMIFFHLILIEAFFSGVIAGKMGEGDPKVGLRHSCILLVFSYICFRIAILLFGG